ncbi:MAG: hypothetical protein IPK75_17775 [Acidobacteria bacterium]|nr:hypothetical protein [Acidobacteriota bacterium]
MIDRRYRGCAQHRLWFIGAQCPVCHPLPPNQDCPHCARPAPQELTGLSARLTVQSMLVDVLLHALRVREQEIRALRERVQALEWAHGG